MAVQPKLDSEDKLVSDHVNGFHYTADNNADNNADNFVIDMESFSNGVDNSRIKLQRNLSRKNSQRGSENKNANENTNSSPVRSSPTGSPSTPEKPGTAGTTTADHSQVHHQITITAGNDGRSVLRRNSFNKRYSRWVIDPRKIVFAFATLSSMGTILLIYLTLSITKYSAEENGIDWQQP